MMTSYDDVMRTIVDLPQPLLTLLDALCQREGISRAEAVRQAVAGHVRPLQREHARRAFGLWRGRRVDGLDYERRVRREWDVRAKPRK